MFSVEIKVKNRFLLATRMKSMRIWLDAKGYEPVFRSDSRSYGIVIQVDFKKMAEAVEFTDAFGGEIIGAVTHMR